MNGSCESTGILYRGIVISLAGLPVLGVFGANVFKEVPTVRQDKFFNVFPYPLNVLTVSIIGVPSGLNL